VHYVTYAHAVWLTLKWLRRVTVCLLDGSVSYDGKAELPMKIFSPFAGFLCVVAAFLLILLFVGVVSETGQSVVDTVYIYVRIVLYRRFFCFVMHDHRKWCVCGINITANAKWTQALCRLHAYLRHATLLSAQCRYRLASSRCASAFLPTFLWSIHV